MFKFPCRGVCSVASVVAQRRLPTRLEPITWRRFGSNSNNNSSNNPDRNISSSSSTSNSTSSSSSSNSTSISMVRVKAYYLACGLNLVKVNENIYGNKKKSRQEPRFVTIEIDKAKNQFVSVFKYGSVVFFNIPEQQHNQHLLKIHQNAMISPLDESTRHTEDYLVTVNPALAADTPSVIHAESLQLRSFDAKHIAIVAEVIAQSVAMDYYAASADSMLSLFMQMNRDVEDSGSFRSLKMKQLHQLIAANNRIIAVVLSKLGIFEGSDAAWDNADYYDTWKELRTDFEIDSRYKDLATKIELVRENTRFFLEILQDQRSTKLEWVIIILIAAEIFLGVYPHV